MYYLLCEQSETFHFKKLESLPPGCFMLCIVWISTVALEKTIVSVIQAISLCPNYLPLENGVARHINKFEFPLPTDA